MTIFYPKFSSFSFLAGYIFGFGSGFLSYQVNLPENGVIVSNSNAYHHQSSLPIITNANKNDKNQLSTSEHNSSIIHDRMTTNLEQLEANLKKDSESLRKGIFSLSRSYQTLQQQQQQQQNTNLQQRQDDEVSLINQMTSVHTMLQTILQQLALPATADELVATTTRTDIDRIKPSKEFLTKSRSSRNETKRIKNSSGNKQQRRISEGSSNSSRGLPPLAKLNCGGSKGAYQDMVYWRDIPQDDAYLSKSLRKDPKKRRRYLSVELDAGGFNNIRMTLEIAMAWAYATGRTFVLPPRQGVYLLSDNETFTLHDFYHLDAGSMNVMEMEDFLIEQVLTGKLIQKNENRVPTTMFPPNNRTDWSKSDRPRKDVAVDEDVEIHQLHSFLRKISSWYPEFQSGSNLVFFPSHKSSTKITIENQYGSICTMDHSKFILQADNPMPTNASAEERLQEIRQGRHLTIITDDDDLDDSSLVHIMADDSQLIRLMTHFYHQLFFEDWRMDLRVKRYVRDRLHYHDKFFCAAGQILEEIRSRHEQTTTTSLFVTIHVRRNDFAHLDLIANASDILQRIEKELPSSSSPSAVVLYIATDEPDREWFTPLMERFQGATYFLDDFSHILKGSKIRPCFYGMLDQIVAAKGDLFFAPYYSTFASHIVHMRGYYSQAYQKEDWKKGALKDTYYYVPLEYKDVFRQGYRSMGEEDPSHVMDSAYPLGWRDIDQGIYDD